MTVGELAFTTAVEQARLVASGDVRARELVEASLGRIARLDPELNAFARVCADEALARADELDDAWRRSGPVGPLHGVPIAIKDENDVAGLPTAYGGAAFSTPVAVDGEVVRRLRAAGAVVVGKTRMPEFGLWPFTETAAHGYTRNPWNPAHSPGGSSGGSAAAVASGMVAVAIGGDGGGSIRIPSSFCALYGLKCSRGRTSAGPRRNLWRSLGVIGPLARTVADSALVYDAVAGTTDADEFRAEPWTTPMLDAVEAPFVPLRIAVSTRNPSHGPRADAATTAAVEATALLLADLGHHVEHVDPDYPEVSLAFLLQVAGGVADEAARAEHRDLLERRTRRFVALTRPFVPLAGLAQRQGLRAATTAAARLFARHDLLLTPTTPTPAPRVGRLDGVGAVGAVLRSTPVASYTSIWNVLGNPAAALPSGFTAQGLPLSVQLIGAPGDERTVVAVSAQLERARPLLDRRPASAPG
jgi:amidase